jgi:uncharacterized protein
MRANDVDGAVGDGVAAMLKTITPSYSGVSAPSEEAQTQTMTGKDAWVLVILGLIFLFAIVVVMKAARGGYLVTGGGFGGGGFGGGGFGGGGFSAGGGGFGGGGASGGW